MFKKKTKIVATISDMRCDVDFIRSLYNAGMNVVRLNTAHQSPHETLSVVKNIRTVSEKIAILVDTKGPEIRTTAADSGISVQADDIVYLAGNPDEKCSAECINVSYSSFVRDVPVGNRILIDDGDLELLVEEKEGDRLKCRVMNSGVIKGKKSINVPGVSLDLPSLSDRDREYIEFCIENDIDFIAHSFVRRKEDVIAIQRILDAKNSSVKIIAKIENQEGVDKIDEIIDYAYGVMIARGDLAIEIPAEKIPYTQKTIIKKCLSRRKPIIVATQMLHSMIDNPRPTRAEISDVANAVYDRTDALMLSGETAYGKYPLESVQMMSKIACEVEVGLDRYNTTTQEKVFNEITAYLAKAAVDAAAELNTTAIVIDTLTGRTARSISVYRGSALVYAECYSKRTVRELALSYGVYANYLDVQDSHRGFIENALGYILERKAISREDRIVIVAGNFGAARGASYIEIGTPNELLAK
ncbi:MAG TPA: pyruvate kinase [Spirochaetota bacterium]|nr:pyruvate kinase [Spirochaetota bacterium]